MGNKVAAFTEEQLVEYQEQVVEYQEQLVKVVQLYREVAAEQGGFPRVVTRDMAASYSVPYQDLDALTELKENPFRRRVCEVFSEDGSAGLTFNEFLEMFSVFSESCPRDIKVQYAFKIYDFDGDGFIGPNDLEASVKHLTHELLSNDEYETIVAKVLEEADVDCDGRLSQNEFKHVILKSPDFVPNFHIRI
ncbi:unnamed protein product, partial [Meganyctiphanes norvegica]